MRRDAAIPWPNARLYLTSFPCISCVPWAKPCLGHPRPFTQSAGRTLLGLLISFQNELKRAPKPVKRSSVAVKSTSTLEEITPDAPVLSLVLGEGRSPDVVAFENRMVGFFVDAAGLLGVPKSVAAIYGLIFATPEPLSFSEIAARLDFSNGSVSQGLKILREIGAIKEAPGSPPPAPGARLRARSVQCFEPDTEMRRLIQRFIEQRLEAQLRRGETSLSALEQTATVHAGEDRQIINQRLAKIRRWHDRTRALVPIMKTFLKLTR